jgi:16S rRNA (adenine1518-N6/adenine1519-N6)-dimethyltransferase
LGRKQDQTPKNDIIVRKMKRRRIKAMGQHFLKNPLISRKIIGHISPQKEDFIIEIGAGKGILTFPLAEKAGKVIAVEKDKAFIPSLRKKSIHNLKILEGDVLKINLAELIKKELDFKGKVKLVGNLPYSISSPVLFKAYQEKDLISGCFFLLQKEVAERVCAEPGSKKYAPLSILFQNHFSRKQLLVVGPESFKPPPKVKSALVSLKKREKPVYPIQREEEFHGFLKGAFRHRRKTLFNNLTMSGYPPSLIEEAFRKFHFSKTFRSEELSLSQFVDLFKFFDRIK